MISTKEKKKTKSCKCIYSDYKNLYENNFVSSFSNFHKSIADEECHCIFWP